MRHYPLTNATIFIVAQEACAAMADGSDRGLSDAANIVQGAPRVMEASILEAVAVTSPYARDLSALIDERKKHEDW